MNDNLPKKHIYRVADTFVSTSGFKIDAAGAVVNSRGQRVDMKSFINNFLLYSLSFSTMRLVDTQIKLSDSAFNKGIEEWLADKKLEAFNKFKLEIQFDPTKALAAKEDLAIWLKSLLWREPTATEIAVLLHFMHQVKRKMFDLKIKYHLMPVIVSAQKSGKTETIRWLLAPLGNFAVEWELSHLEDPRYDMKHKDTYVMFFDELAKAERADMKTLKKRITAIELDVRNLGTQIFSHIKQNSTFIAASNEAINELLADSTGMRRFHQIIGVDREELLATTIEERQKYWELKRDLNPMTIWQGVNEQLELLPEYEQALEDIDKSQELLRNKDILEEFWIDSGFELITDKDPDKKDLVRVTSFYSDFRDYAEQAGERYPWSRRLVKQKLFNTYKVNDKRFSDGKYFLIKKRNRGEINAENNGVKLKLFSKQIVEGEVSNDE